MLYQHHNGALCARKAVTDSEDADISGDYNTYDTQDILTVDSLDVGILLFLQMPFNSLYI